MTDLPAPMPHPEGQPANDATQSTGPTSAAVAHDVFETEAARLATVPIWLLALSGTLRLADGRLSFRTRSKTLVDAPLSEIHSVAENAIGLVSWQGETQHRFTFGRPASARLYSNNLALARVPSRRRSAIPARHRRTHHRGCSGWSRSSTSLRLAWWCHRRGRSGRPG